MCFIFLIVSSFVVVITHLLNELKSNARWGRYDLLIMPPCFPFGGMENPRLTFVTPCLITGDGALGDVVAHEIAHSWYSWYLHFLLLSYDYLV